MSLYQLFPRALLSYPLMFRFQSSPEYDQRARKPFTPPNIPLAALHCAIPKRLHRRSTKRSLYYIARHLIFTWAFYILACHIDSWSSKLSVRLAGPSSSDEAGEGAGERNLDVEEVGRTLLRMTMSGVGWCVYWWWQGIAFAGIWCLAHEVRLFLSSDTDWGRVPSVLGLANFVIVSV